MSDETHAIAATYPDSFSSGKAVKPQRWSVTTKFTVDIPQIGDPYPTASFADLKPMAPAPKRSRGAEVAEEQIHADGDRVNFGPSGATYFMECSPGTLAKSDARTLRAHWLAPLIDAEIASAVRAEREACADAVAALAMSARRDAEHNYFARNDGTMKRNFLQAAGHFERAVAALRART